MKKSILTILALCFLTFSACAQSSKTTGEKTMGTTINITVNGVTKTATLVDNVATKALLELLAKGNVTVKTNDYSGFEKVGTFGTRLPTANSQIDTVPGDIVLYHGNNISFFYDYNGWSYTMLGKLDIVDVDEIKTFLAAGKGKTDIVLSLK
ncbi:MAG: hypothetical protein MJ184_11405 [Treponema sp.]|uniref:cyclophilin-like fold protein n=1 Tax=Treponema sp. TaxID=166 RepID=UPI00298DE664|nr:cyclophilin-like fold protein [Treponema sp.]MCQ2601955.1 hypothetical protein [Treponema sp.]